MTEVPSRSEGRAFVRTLAIPPGAPWDQARAARLDAVHGAPLGGDALVWSVRRLEPWRPRTPGRFAAAYVRRDAIPDQDLTLEIDGSHVQFRFARPELRGRRAANLGVTGGLAALAIIVLGLDVQKALELRTERGQRLDRLEANAGRWERVSRRERKQQADAALLRKAGAERASFADFAADLFWLGQAKAPSATIQRVQWRADAMQVVSLGAGPPVLGSERPLASVGEVAGAREWRIGGQAPPVVRAGIARPSVVLGPAEQTVGSAR